MSQLALHPQRRHWTPEIDGLVARVPLTRGRFALVDTADLPIVEGRTWSVVMPNGSPYAMASAHRDGTPMIYMHRLILGLTDPSIEGDHINGDGLDNRRSNLRPATRAQNMANVRSRRGTSRFKGVCWAPRERKWRSYIKTGGKQLGGGYFDDEEEAARAHDRLASEAWGEFAHLNFPEDKP